MIHFRLFRAILVALIIAAPVSSLAQINEARVREVRMKISSDYSSADYYDLAQAYELGVAGVKTNLYLAAVNYSASKAPAAKQGLARVLAKVRKGADTRDAQTMYWLGMIYHDRVIAPPGAKPITPSMTYDVRGRVKLEPALPFLESAARAGSAEAAKFLASQFSTSHSGMEDHAKSFEWLRLAAETGDLEAERRYASALWGRNRNVEAVSWYRKAASHASVADESEIRDVEASSNMLAQAYADGKGAPRDYAQAIAWYRRSGATGRRDFQKFMLAHPELAEKEVMVANRPALTPTGEAALQTIATKPYKIGPRFALVIGNGGYGSLLGRLANPVNDARLIAQSLRASGFEVDLVINADQRTMKAAVNRLGDKLRAGGADVTGLFYYAGHGMQSRGTNYLAPINAAIETEADLELEAVAADNVLQKLNGSGAKTTIMILDACRNMPLTRATRDGSRGLARMDVPRAFIAYSTAPGETASDGDGVNSPFSVALAEEIGQKGVPIEVAFRNVRAKVSNQTSGRQTPWDSSSLTDDFLFTP